MGSALDEDQLEFDPLSAVTRAERRAFLGVSGLGIAIATIPIVPAKLSLLGLEFSDISRARFLFCYAALVLYFMIAFAIYAWSDYVAFRRKLVIRVIAYDRAKKDLAQGDSEHDEAGEVGGSDEQVYFGRQWPWGGRATNAWTGAASWGAGLFAIRLRIFFELVLPLLIGGSAVVLLAHLASKIQ